MRLRLRCGCKALQKTCQMTGRFDKIVKSQTWVSQLWDSSLRLDHCFSAFLILVEVDFPLLSSPSIGRVSYMKRKWFSFATTVRELVLVRKRFNSVGNWLRQLKTCDARTKRNLNKRLVSLSLVGHFKKGFSLTVDLFVTLFFSLSQFFVFLFFFFSFVSLVKARETPRQAPTACLGCTSFRSTPQSLPSSFSMLPMQVSVGFCRRGKPMEVIAGCMLFFLGPILHQAPLVFSERPSTIHLLGCIPDESPRAHMKP